MRRLNDCLPEAELREDISVNLQLDMGHVLGHHAPDNGERIMTMTFEEHYAAVIAFATAAHKGQFRKYTGRQVPYVTHPIAVAKAVEKAGGDKDQVTAAILHDTIEDTGVTYEDIVIALGTTVADLVREVTDVYTSEAYPGHNRAWRKTAEADRLATISDKAKLIKRFDIADNTSSIVALDPGFATLYLKEVAYTLSVMFPNAAEHARIDEKVDG